LPPSVSSGHTGTPSRVPAAFLSLLTTKDGSAVTSRSLPGVLRASASTVACPAEQHRLRKALAEGLAQADRGELTDGHEVVAELRKRQQKRRRFAKRRKSTS
jgi:predicted transcriptional regulator